MMFFSVVWKTCNEGDLLMFVIIFVSVPQDSRICATLASPQQITFVLFQDIVHLF